MRLFRILTFKELKGYFLTPFGWVVLAFVTIMQGVSLSTAMKGFRDTPVRDSLVYVTFHTPLFWFYFLFIFPLITMRLFSEEERSGTLETLLTAPVRTWQVVFSKYAAAMIFYTVLWIPGFIQFKMFEWITHLPPAFTPGALGGAFTAVMLMGAAFTAIGCLASALTSSQIIAGILTIGLLVIQYFMGYVTIIWGESFAGAEFFHYISSQQHLHYFASGLFDTRPIVYFLSLALFVLFLTYQVVELPPLAPLIFPAMSESSSESKGKPARPLNRWGLGTLSVFQIAFLAIILIALNYLAAHHFTRLDLSREAAYSLSPATKGYLKSKALKDHAKPIKWIMAFRRSSPFYERVRALAEEYERHSGGKVNLIIVDPLRSSDRAQEVAAAYGLPLTKDLLIMDARIDDGPVSTEQKLKATSADPVADEKPVRVLNPHVKIIVADDMAVYTTGGNQRKISGFQGEDVLTARLVESIEGRTRKMVFLADKSRLDFEGENSPMKSLQDTLQFQNVELRGINLSGLAEIPADAEGVVMVAPKYDLTDEEVAVLEKYWNRPRAAMLFLLKAGDTPPKLRTFLRSNGVTPRRDRVISRVGERIDTTARGMFTYGVDFIKDLSGQATVLEGASSSLEVREGAEDLTNRQIAAIGLIETPKEFWGETKFGEKNIAFDEKEDTKGPLQIAASVTRGAVSDDRFVADISRMVVISNTDFLDPRQQRAENIDFLASSVNWLMNRESLAGIGPRSLGTYKLPILDAQVSFINRVNLFFLPAFLIVAGAFIWSSRRA